MCGIIGYLGPKPAVNVLMDGLKKLEYRGYDSAGIAILDNGAFDIRRAVGKLGGLQEKVVDNPPTGNIGIGHTRWATHGRPSDTNAHPHAAGDISLIHNGIIENYVEIKQELLAKGRSFLSETDTEVAAHLIDDIYQRTGDFLASVQEALKRIEGAYALLIINQKAPDMIIAARKESPLICGIGDDEMFFASDVPAFLTHTNRVIFLEDGELAVMERGKMTIYDGAGNQVNRSETVISWSPVMAEKAGYKHFMLKEIFEQPRAVTDTFRGRISPDKSEVYLDEIGLTADELKSFSRIVICACGTSYHAGLTAKFMIEDLARLPVEVDLASEFRYRNLLIGPETLVIFISQSGETLDTMGAMRQAKTTGAKILSICNVLGSSVTRESDGVLYTHAGPEIGVASTKAFTTQLTALYLIAIYLGRVRGVINGDRTAELIDELIKLPGLIEKTLELDDLIQKVAQRHAKASDFLYLGRGINYPIALEGALKLKEISYIHAEGYPAGEMKHGPIALIDESLPVVVLAPRDKTWEKILNNVEEVKARDGLVIAFGQAGDDPVKAKADDYIALPLGGYFLNPIIFAVPLQLLAYHVAVIRGTDVDQPRNLAKSVTVE